MSNSYITEKAVCLIFKAYSNLSPCTWPAKGWAGQEPSYKASCGTVRGRSLHVVSDLPWYVPEALV